jgi:fucose permease
MGSPLDLSKDDLLTLYKIALEEYRFQVRLNWDRTTYHLTLSSGLIAIAAGLLKFGPASPVNLAVAGVFFIGMCVSAIGIKTIRTGHDYYRHTIVKKTVLEDQLGLTKPLEGYSAKLTLAVGTTVGQNEHLKILNPHTIG